MAKIVIQFNGSTTPTAIAAIPGSSNSVTDGCDAEALFETIEVPVTGAGRGSGSKEKHSDIQLTRRRDKASPKLAEACAAGDSIGGVVITVTNEDESTLTYTLTKTYVSRYETETLDESGAAYLRHLGSPRQPSPPSAAGVGALGPADGVRVAPRPLLGVLRGAAQTTELERIWLQPATVTWEYKKGDTRVTKAWNIETGRTLDGAV